MDDAADFAAVLALNRDNIAPISHGNDALLQIFGGVHVTDHALQPVADAVLGDADLFAQLVQGMGSCIRHGVWGQNGTGDLLLQTGLWCQRIKQVVRRQGIVVGGAVPAAQILKVAQRTGHHQQLAHGEHAALDRTGHELADALHAAKAGRAVFDQQTIDGVGLLQRVAHFVRVALGFQRKHLRFCFLTDAALGGTRNDLIKLKCF